MIFFDMGHLFRPDVFAAALDYSVDTFQRSVLFSDILRKRGNDYIEHLMMGQPPVLVFDFEMVLDGRVLERPVNYSIVKIIERREHGKLSAQEPDGLDSPNRRRPIVVIDPRAGHGPGIGGSKLDSQIGVALKAGHPVYFVLFYPDPEPGQTLADIQHAEVQFLEEVIRRHPESEPPAVIGNCQAGWAAALIGADRPDVTGPLVFNGSPLSYWGGVDGANPMRYGAGLCGGNWVTSLWCDLGNGQFDGALLVANFENLNPANTLWSKQYHVYSNVDTEETRYLSFEKWWGGFFKMNREEIHFIVDSLFVGNELEHGLLELEPDKWINLKNFKDPIVVFASAGDNITPPQQALNWIYKVYKTVDEIKRNGQVIVYILHPKIGHLGIFVGSRVARKEHAAIIDTVDMIEYLAPGLYEMYIVDEEIDGVKNRQVKFIERTMNDILGLDDGLEDEEAFHSVSAVSRANDVFYKTLFSPWVRMMTNEVTAEVIRQTHPLRLQRYAISDINPLTWPSMLMAPWVKSYRKQASQDNPFVLWEKSLSKAIESGLNSYRDYRDMMQERMFKFLYDTPVMKTIFPDKKPIKEILVEPLHVGQEKVEKELWRKAMLKGGFETAMIRVSLIIALANSTFDQRQYLLAFEIVQTSDRLNHMLPKDMKRIVKEQASLVEYDMNMAIATLSKLLPHKEERLEIYAIAQSLAEADQQVNRNKQKQLEKIETALGL